VTDRITALALAALLLTALLLTACSGTPEVDAPASSWGAPVMASSTLTVADLFDRAEELDGQPLVVRGEVIEVCQSKGCWMVLSDGERSMRVRFVDYAFFVPMDLTGEVVIEGTFAIKMVSVDEARHYLEDAGRYEEAEAVSEPSREFSFLASGVRRG